MGTVYSLPNEYIFKSIFLQKFAAFIEWPEPQSNSDTFIIGIYGDNSYHNIIEKVYADKSIKNKPVQIRYLSSPEEAKGCHMVIIAQANDDDLQYFLKLSQQQGLLTIADIEEYVYKGAILGFYKQSNETIRFSINKQAMQSSPLHIKFMLIEIAKIIEQRSAP